MLKNHTGSRGPETATQAATWERVKNHALAFGLCPACSAQLAWGHQNGFATVHPPCPSCAAAVRRLPSRRPNGWRTVEGMAADRRAWTALNAFPDVPGVPGPGRAVTVPRRARAARQGVA